MGAELANIDKDIEIMVKSLSLSTLCELEALENCIIENGLNKIKEINDAFMGSKVHGGLYGRALMIPKGTFLTGKIHKNDYMDILVSGDITLKSFFSDGTIESANRYNEFTFFDGKKGRKRVGIAHEDTVWLTVDKTKVTDKAFAEDDITVCQMKDYMNLSKELKWHQDL